MPKILVVRLGAMGDVLHTMPAVQHLREAHRDAEITWVIEPRWAPLLAGSEMVDHILPMDRRKGSSILIATKWLRRWKPDVAIDFQGLWKSAITAWVSGADRRLGFASGMREREAGVFYSECIEATRLHIVERNLELAGGLQAPQVNVPPGHAEGNLPDGDFLLAAPFAGWNSKQWPAARYAEIAERLHETFRMKLVLNVMPGTVLPASEFLVRHESGIEGLMDATRRARAVLGLDSGPMHLAALLRKPGVALFGPTDPARNGPYGGTIRVLRVADAETTYRRGSEIAESMKQLDVDSVWQALVEVLR
ncbi:glycosyltransferase family 9 protein [Bryobacter aggregatus]|uniref:glycosyltransferase family 9 protein n=1 Tax=Bryobacter aggregatus TaxID=360054 RepID=UPI00068A4AA0|nr:glycosyltransferase family 9 protein [Bryobacter aggregatus]